MEPRFKEIKYNIETGVKKVTTSLAMVVVGIILMSISIQARTEVLVPGVMLSVLLLGFGVRGIHRSVSSLLVYIVLADHATDMRTINKIKGVNDRLRKIREIDFPNREVPIPLSKEDVPPWERPDIVEPDLSTIRGASTNGGDIPLPTK